MPTNTVTGGCLCGQVRFSYNGSIHSFHACHCTQCQRTTGTAHAANLIADSGELNWTAGATAVIRYDVPGRSISNAFCNRCGAALPFHSLTNASTIIPAGCLDEPPPLSLTRHIFWEERAAWYDELAQVPQDIGFGAND